MVGAMPPDEGCSSSRRGTGAAPACSSCLTPRHVRSRRRPNRDPRESAEALLGQLDQLWGTEAMAQLTVPSRADDERFGRWFAKLLRSTASPRAAQAFLRVMLEIDARPLLLLIHAPTLVLHRTSNPLIAIEHGLLGDD